MRLKIGRLFGIDIYLHWTFALVPIVLVFNWKYQLGMDWSMIAAMSGLVGIAFVCVLMHEYGHALAARQLGISTRDIMITPIGGLARLERMPRDPKQELFVTFAGPFVNLVLAVLIGGLVFALGLDFYPTEATPIREQYLPLVMWLNTALFVFNLVPAFPMDGGRILRSVLAFFMTHRNATTIATLIGQTMAIGFVVVGVYLSQYSLVFIGCFVFYAASLEIRNSRLAEQVEVVK